MDRKEFEMCGWSYGLAFDGLVFSVSNLSMNGALSLAFPNVVNFTKSNSHVHLRLAAECLVDSSCIKLAKPWPSAQGNCEPSAITRGLNVLYFKTPAVRKAFICGQFLIPCPIPLHMKQ